VRHRETILTYLCVIAITISDTSNNIVSLICCFDYLISFVICKLTAFKNLTRSTSQEIDSFITCSSYNLFVETVNLCKSLLKKWSPNSSIRGSSFKNETLSVSNLSVWKVIINGDNCGFSSDINIESINSIFWVGPHFRNKHFLNSLISLSNG
jgi:hypothetical protein